jgi:hypothetical protein
VIDQTWVWGIINFKKEDFMKGPSEKERGDLAART